MALPRTQCGYGGNLRVRWEPQKSCTFIAVYKFRTDPKVTLAFSSSNARGSEYLCISSNYTRHGTIHPNSHTARLLSNPRAMSRRAAGGSELEQAPNSCELADKKHVAAALLSLPVIRRPFDIFLSLV
jgi:hypothetical protein